VSGSETDRSRSGADLGGSGRRADHSLPDVSPSGIDRSRSGSRTVEASEKARIYSCLESEAAYAFTDADFVQTIPLARTVTGLSTTDKSGIIINLGDISP
jgi:hypothetical protein